MPENMTDPPQENTPPPEWEWYEDMVKELCETFPKETAELIARARY